MGGDTHTACHGDATRLPSRGLSRLTIFLCSRRNVSKADTPILSMPFFFCLAGVVQKSWFPVGQGGILVFASALVHTTRRLFVNLLGVKNRRFSMRLHERRTIAWKGPKTCERACTACDS